MSQPGHGGQAAVNCRERRTRRKTHVNCRDWSLPSSTVLPGLLEEKRLENVACPSGLACQRRVVVLAKSFRLPVVSSSVEWTAPAMSSNNAVWPSGATTDVQLMKRNFEVDVYDKTVNIVLVFVTTASVHKSSFLSL